MKKYYERYWSHSEELEDFHYKWPAIKRFIPRERVKLLDLGCGKGRILKEMLQVNPSLAITGVDVSETSIAYAKKHFPKQTFKHISDGNRLPFASSSFDFVTALDVLEHIYDTQLIFSELARVMKKDAKLLITVPYFGLLKNIIIALIGFDFVYNPRGPHIRFYTKGTLLKEVESAGLRVVSFGYFGRFFPLSNGMYCLCEKAKRDSLKAQK